MVPFLRIRRAGIGLAIALAMLSSALPIRPVAMGAQDPHTLVPGVAIERELSANGVHAYRFALARGDMLRLTIGQQGIDVAAALLAPDGRELIALDAMDDEFRPEVIVAIAEMDGVYTAMARPAPRSRPPGRYRIRLDAPRPAIASDQVQIEAARAFARGRTRRDVDNAATWPEALADFKTALDRYRAVGDGAGEMKSLIEIAVTENYLSRPEALSPADQAERLARVLDDRPAIARVLRVLASIHSLAGNFEAAAHAVEEATTINRAIGNRRAEANSLNYTALMYRQLGEIETAIALYEEALPITRAANDRALEANIVNNLAAVYSILGEPDKARSMYEQALADARTAKNLRAQFTALGNLGLLQLRLGHQANARTLFDEALAIARTIGDTGNEGYALNNVGVAHHFSGEYATALKYHREAVETARRVGDISRQAWALAGAGEALLRLGDNEQGFGLLREALAIRRQIRDSVGQASTLRVLAAVERDRGNLSEALRHITEAIDLDEGVRGQMTSPDLRASYVAARHNSYNVLIDVLQQLHANNPDQGYAAAALHVSERARARVLLESLLDARVDLRQGIDATLLERERALQKQLNDASAQLSRVFAGNTREQHLVAAQTLERLTAEYQKLQAEIRRQSPRYAAVMQPRPLDLAEIRSAVLDDDTVLLEFAVGQERSWLWAVTSTTLKTVELPARREIDTAARSLYEHLTARQKRRGENNRDYAERVRAADAGLDKHRADVSRMLLGGIARELHEEWRTKRLAIVASGALEYLPFAALPMPERTHAGTVARAQTSHQTPASRTPLAADHEIVSIPSASVLAVLRRETAGRAPAPRTLAIVADPVFDGTDPRVRQGPANPTMVKDHTASRAIEVMDSLYARGGLSRLPFSREEADAIGTLARKADVFTAVDFNASRATVLGGALSGYRIVHLATHGLVDSERPALSSLVLSLVDARGGRQNGYLRLADIYNLRLDAELVVLSACQTALGKEIRGEGLVGLTRAFLYAGAPRVVASLWQVSDLATAELMKKFYRGMLRQHLPPAAALRAAQVEMAQDPRWASPYYWAGFVLQGEWR